MPHSRYALLALPLLALSLLTSARPAQCQATGPKPADLTAALSGSVHPLSLKLKDLDSSWRVFSFTGGAGDASGQLGAYFALLTGGGQSSYYTRGESVTLGGEVYLVAYHQKIRSIIPRCSTGKPPTCPRLRSRPRTPCSRCPCSACARSAA